MTSRTSSILVLLALVGTTPACSAAPEEDDEAAESSSAASDDETQSGELQEVPTDGDALLPWLESGAYEDWVAESGPHVSAGPHGSTVRTFVNDALASSLAANTTAHPIGAATVKELFGSDGDLIGWAAMVKVASGEGGDGWYWYELAGSTEYADGTGESLCTGCHSAGIDSVLTPWPLQ